MVSFLNMDIQDIQDSVALHFILPILFVDVIYAFLFEHGYTGYAG